MSDLAANNPREVIGGNNPPLARTIAAEENFAATVTAFLEDEYSQLPVTVSHILEAARAIPHTIDNEDDMGECARVIKLLRDEAARIEAFRVKEKEPYLRGEQAVDAYFFGQKEKCVRRDKKAKPGAADILQSLLDDYNQRKLAAEQRRRQEEADKAAREAAEARQREQEAAAKAEADRQAAERARKPETQQQKTAIAEASQQEAADAAVNADLAAQAAEQAHVDTLAKPADLVRTRVSQGPTVTMGTEPYALIEDIAQLDRAVLWPFIKTDAIESALRSWAKTTNYNQQMAGARIGRRPKSIVR